MKPLHYFCCLSCFWLTLANNPPQAHVVCNDVITECYLSLDELLGAPLGDFDSCPKWTHGQCSRRTQELSHWICKNEMNTYQFVTWESYAGCRKCADGILFVAQCRVKGVGTETLLCMFVSVILMFCDNTNHCWPVYVEKVPHSRYTEADFACIFVADEIGT